jgi:hypothetical protein
MGKALQITVVFEYSNVADPRGELANVIIDGLMHSTETWRAEHDADAVWIDEARIREGVEV